jgi:hypothetical protein
MKRYPRVATRTCAVGLLGLLGLAIGCAETPTAPTLADPSGPAFGLSAGGFSVQNLLLRPAEGSSATAWGELTVFVGALAPPNPCGEKLVAATVIACGVINNPGGELLEGGFLLVLAAPDAEPVRLEFTLPPNPCLTYLVSASALVPELATVGLELPAVQVEFTTTAEGRVPGTIVSVGATPGPPNLHPGGVNDPGTAVPPNPCLVGFTATRV